MVLREETMHIVTIGVHILDKAKLLYHLPNISLSMLLLFWGS